MFAMTEVLIAKIKPATNHSKIQTRTHYNGEISFEISQFIW